MKRNFQSNSSKSLSIEKEITAIYNHLQAFLKEDLSVEKLPPAKRSVFCKGIINVYADIEKEKTTGNNPSKREPVVSYAFYADTYTPSKIGSVAIYGEGAHSRVLTLKKRGFLFGRRIRSVGVENGRRPFVDVKFVV